MNGEEKLIIFLKLMQERDYDAYIIPRGDQHNNREFIAEADERIKFISNFSGNNAIGLVTKNAALIWTSNGNFSEIEKDIYPCWEAIKMKSDDDIIKYILKNVPKNSIIGIDYSLFTEAKANNIMRRLDRYEFIDDKYNIIDDIWGTLKPNYNINKLIILPENLSGLSIIKKCKLLEKKLKVELGKNMIENYRNNTYRLLISKLDDISWLLNLKGNDIKYNNVFFSFAFFYFSAKNYYIYLYINKAKKVNKKITEYCINHNIHLFEYNDIYKDLITSDNDNIITIFDINTTNYRMSSKIFENSPGKIRILENNCFEELKSIKNKSEIEGIKNANIKDSISFIKFSSWLEEEIITKNNTILNKNEIVTKNKQIHEKQELYIGESFEPIFSDLAKNKSFLYKSGSHYLDGSTSISRTLHFGNPTPKEKEIYTRVLLGSLSFERIFFNDEDFVGDLDVIPRYYLNMIGKNYEYATCIGIKNNEQLKLGSVVISEPGYYEKNEFNIKIGNQLLVFLKKENKFGFENLTFIPYERNLIDMELVSKDFKKYIDDYHKKIFEILSPKLKDDKIGLNYLKRKTDPL